MVGDFFLDAENRYSEAVARRDAIRDAWEAEDSPLLATGSTGQLVEHPSSATPWRKTRPTARSSPRTRTARPGRSTPPLPRSLPSTEALFSRGTVRQVTLEHRGAEAVAGGGHSAPLIGREVENHVPVGLAPAFDLRVPAGRVAGELEHVEALHRIGDRVLDLVARNLPVRWRPLRALPDLERADERAEWWAANASDLPLVVFV